MTAKCPVCAYDLPSKPIEVNVGQKVVKVCCQECADTIRKQGEVKTAK
jgi:hypothetical protein